MHRLIDLESYPIDQSGCEGYRALVDRYREQLNESGMFNLSGFLRTEVCGEAVKEIEPIMIPAVGATERIIAVFSFYEFPGKVFSDQERIGFYGRAS
jgi:hypothetical protein